MEAENKIYSINEAIKYKPTEFWLARIVVCDPITLERLYLF